MLFSVILATRDRPALFAEALNSVMAQARENLQFEIIVVNDGSSAEHLPAYQQLWSDAAHRLGALFQVHHLARRAKGHGQSYSLNHGVSQANGRYVCFLDDDDRWTDDAHLSRVCAAVAAADGRGQPLDLYFANQDAWVAEKNQRVGTLWLGALGQQMRANGHRPDELGLYAPSLMDLMACDGFCHLNCLTVRRSLYLDVGGMDEGIRWECDRDLYLKLVEAAGSMRHHPDVMSYHRVPDPTKANNMTTTLGMLDKRLLQSLVLDKALIRTRSPLILAHARRHKVYALQRMAQTCLAQGDGAKALLYAGQALGLGPSPGRLALVLRCTWSRCSGGLKPESQG